MITPAAGNTYQDTMIIGTGKTYQDTEMDNYRTTKISPLAFGGEHIPREISLEREK